MPMATWLSLAAAQSPVGSIGNEALQARNQLAPLLTPAEIAEAEDKVAAWRPIEPWKLTLKHMDLMAPSRSVTIASF